MSNTTESAARFTVTLTQGETTTPHYFTTQDDAREWLADKLESMGAALLRDNKLNEVAAFNAAADEVREDSGETSETVGAVRYTIGAYIPADMDKAIAQLAADFSGNLREWLTADQMAEVISRNASETDKNICHSHDFCDANQAMIDQFFLIWKREPLFNLDSDTNAINKAWDIAKTAGFYMTLESTD